jgi:hypothetical protein
MEDQRKKEVVVTQTRLLIALCLCGLDVAWFDRKVKFTNADGLKEFSNMHQYDPKGLVDG